jgi:hypothetical protein
MNEKTPDVSVAAFAYAAKPLLTAARSLLWNEAKPSGKLTARLELSWVSHRGNNGACRNWADSGDTLEPATSWISAMPR